MRRRQFMALIGAGVAWPLSVHAQYTGKVYRIGFLGNSGPVALKNPASVDAGLTKCVERVGTVTH
jgi:hypothetical protein